ncbi:MAG TPA: protein-disulfide reductase DsbD domain-containing protein [Tepidisphaeraceae bacterium]|jgi:thiol:disulfide interchange protein DsbD
MTPYRLAICFPLLLSLLTLLAPMAQAQLNFPPLGQPTAPASPTVKAVLNQDSLPQGGEAALAIVLDIPAGLHTQSHTPLDEFLIPLIIEVSNTPGIAPAPPVYPVGKRHTYPALGEVSVYEGRVTFYVPLKVNSDAPIGDVTISGVVNYQACTDKVCFPPAKLTYSVQTRITPAASTVAPANAEAFSDFQTQAAAATRTPAIFGWSFSSDAYALTFALALLSGVLFNIVPCVLPVLPLKAMSFYHVAQKDRARSMLLGAAFSIGIILTFGALAMIVLVFQQAEWGQLFGKPWFVGTITLVLIAMAAGSFGLWEVVLPTSAYAFTPRQDTLTGNVLFGILTAILSTPCTFGLFIGLLIWAAAQPAWIGVSAVMTAGLGMALPYFILSATPELARKIPSTGPWSNVVKQLTGFLLLGVAAYFGRTLMPDALRGPMYWWALFAVVAAAGLFLIVRTIQLAPRTVPIAISIVLALAAVAPAAYFAKELTKPTVDWVQYTSTALDESRRTGQPVVVKFTADWCLNCQTIEATVFGDTKTQQRLREGKVISVKVDLTHTTAPGWELLRQLTPVAAIPFTAVYLPDEENPRVLTGIYSSKDLLDTLNLNAK